VNRFIIDGLKYRIKSSFTSSIDNVIQNFFKSFGGELKCFVSGIKPGDIKTVIDHILLSLHREPVRNNQ